MASLPFAHYVVLLASLDRDLQYPLEQFAAECDAVMLVDCLVQVREGQYTCGRIQAPWGFIHAQW